MVNRGEEKVWVQMNVVPRSTGNTNNGTRELTLKCKLKCYFKPMNNPWIKWARAKNSPGALCESCPTPPGDHHCFSNTVIGWSFGVCLGAEELEQWYGDRRDFLANLPTHATRASRSPRFCPCSPEIRKKSHLFCRLKATDKSVA